MLRPTCSGRGGAAADVAATGRRQRHETLALAAALAFAGIGGGLAVVEALAGVHTVAMDLAAGRDADALAWINDAAFELAASFGRGRYRRI